MNGLILHPADDMPGRRDATGAFIPEARAFAELHGIPRHRVRAFPFDRGREPLHKRRVISLQAIRSVPETVLEADRLRCLALFCHGYRRGVQAGFTVRHVAMLAEDLAPRSRKDLVVALYCCDTARDSDPDRADDLKENVGGDGGFADELRDALCRVGLVDCRVYGHTVVGHTTRAPWVRVFEGGGSPVGGQGGVWLVRPGGPMWKRWARALRDTASTLRLRYPLMRPADVLAELAAAA